MWLASSICVDTGKNGDVNSADQPAPRKATAAVQVHVMSADGTRRVQPDRLATEEPMSIRIGGPRQSAVDVTITMRTPGHDFELAIGFAWAEGIISDAADVHEVKYCDLPEDGIQRYNIVTILTRQSVDVLPRAFTTTSSCGICGTRSIDDIVSRMSPIPEHRGPIVRAQMITQVPEALRKRQRVFDMTGGLHAAALVAIDGTIELLREDVGRHNAVDKIVGRLVLDRRLPANDRLLFVSGRTSFEIVQKAAMAGISLVAGVSAPTSLAVETATALGITLVGFVRGDTMNVYSHPARINV
jgi:FdhD protein